MLETKFFLLIHVIKIMVKIYRTGKISCALRLWIFNKFIVVKKNLLGINNRSNSHISVLRPNPRCCIVELRCRSDNALYFFSIKIKTIYVFESLKHYIIFRRIKSKS